MSIININNLTKDYGHNRGIFDVDIKVEKGIVYGFLGPNGAGKTTTIRHIMGFSHPEQGTVHVNGLDSWKYASDIQNVLGYLPGEVALPENLTGDQFITYMAKLRGVKDMAHTEYLKQKFKLDSSGNLKRMSLGMKRKLAIVTAFMHDPDILVLDEPTSGLDPVMQDVFIDFIIEEKKRGKTILLSSHIFTEIDATCDIISIIKDGRIISTFNASELKKSNKKIYKVEYYNKGDLEKVIDLANKNNIEVNEINYEKLQLVFNINETTVNLFTKLMSGVKVVFISEIKFTLEDYFMEFYDRK
ncbi:MAG: ABC transporter ATP-binding protein [Mycoplasmatales bacterium]